MTEFTDVAAIRERKSDSHYFDIPKQMAPDWADRHSRQAGTPLPRDTRRMFQEKNWLAMTRGLAWLELGEAAPLGKSAIGRPWHGDIE